MEVKTVVLPVAKYPVEIRKLGPVSIERALGYLPLSAATLADAEKSKKMVEDEDEKGFSDLIAAFRENLVFARKLISEAAVKPRFVEEIDPDKIPAGARSIEDLDFTDYWFLFESVYKFAGVGEISKIVRPISATASGS